MSDLSSDIDFNAVIESDDSHIAPGEIIIGVVQSINIKGEPCVDFPGNRHIDPLTAISTISITSQHVGKNIAILFSKGNLNSPIIMGLIHNPLNEMLEKFNQQTISTVENNVVDSNVLLESEAGLDDVLIDGNKITFEAKDIIELKCGESSIILSKAGKILIKGKYLLNEASGVNRIRGGSVQVN